MWASSPTEGGDSCHCYCSPWHLSADTFTNPKLVCSGVRAFANNRQMGCFRTMAHQGSRNAKAERALVCCRIYCYLLNWGPLLFKLGTGQIVHLVPSDHPALRFRDLQLPFQAFFFPIFPCKSYMYQLVPLLFRKVSPQRLSLTWRTACHNLSSLPILPFFSSFFKHLGRHSLQSRTSYHFAEGRSQA